nr:hypothetical protein [Cupriavidus sp. WGlv3]
MQRLHIWQRPAVAAWEAWCLGRSDRMADVMVGYANGFLRVV